MQPDSLPSWRESEAKAAIAGFVERVSSTGSADFVEPFDRIAVFDNDGTLWCEKPFYVQGEFIAQRVRAMVEDRAELAENPVVRALAEGDFSGAVAAGGLEGLMGPLLGAHEGLTAEEFSAEAAQWLTTAVHPRFSRPYSMLVYQPMLELIELLRKNRFRVFIITGGGVEFVRSVSERVYGVSPDDVVGSAVELEVVRVGGVMQLVRKAQFRGSPNEGAPKVQNIQGSIGQRPILAAGNTAGDREMLEYAFRPDRPSLSLVIDHDDSEREYAYSGASFTDPGAASIATTASRFGWTVVSMRDDWEKVFPDGTHP